MVVCSIGIINQRILWQPFKILWLNYGGLKNFSCDLTNSPVAITLYFNPYTLTSVSIFSLLSCIHFFDIHLENSFIQQSKLPRLPVIFLIFIIFKEYCREKLYAGHS